MQKQTEKRKNRNLILAAAAAVVICTAAVLAAGWIKNGDETPHSTEPLIVLHSGETLDISIDEITAQASFYPVEVDGVRMEVIAVRDSQGEIRMAFNTCQVCYRSSRAYYEQSGEYLVCQNCGNRFSMDQVGIEAGGCNPCPIFDSNRIAADDKISIPYAFLAQCKALFA